MTSARDGTRGLPGIGSARAAGAVLLLAYGWWAVSLPPFSATATVAVLGGGAAAIVAGTCGRRRRRSRTAEVGSTGPWLLLASVGALWQVAAFVQGPRDEHPTLSSLTNALLGSQPARAAAFALWAVAMAGLSRLSRR